MIDWQIFFDQSVKSNLRTFERTFQGDDYTTGCLWEQNDSNRFK